MYQQAIFLIFAADRDGAFLRSIADEQGEILKTFRAHLPPEKNPIIIPNGDFAELEKQLVASESVWILHYGGHSDEESLIIRSRQNPQKYQGKSLAELLQLRKEVQLVFLNGCSNKRQGQTLLQHNVKYVIVTNSRISDTAAKEFSALFYRSYLIKPSVSHAFQEASLLFERQHHEAEENPYGRGLDWEIEEDFPWILLPEIDDTSFQKDIKSQVDDILLLFGTSEQKDIEIALEKSLDFVRDYAKQNRRDYLVRTIGLKGLILKEPSNLQYLVDLMTLLDEIVFETETALAS